MLFFHQRSGRGKDSLPFYSAPEKFGFIASVAQLFPLNICGVGVAAVESRKYGSGYSHDIVPSTTVWIVFNALLVRNQIVGSAALFATCCG